MQNISVDEALRAVVQGIAPLVSEAVALYDADGRMLAEDVVSPIDLPPFANSAMDGYAVVAADTDHASESAPVRLTVSELIAAGQQASEAVTRGSAARIMTGAPIPPGADAVVKFEDTSDMTGTAGATSTAGDSVEICVAVAPGNYIRRPGEDIRRGQVALRAGTPLHPAAIGLLAAMGYATARCLRQPRVAIISTGDELVPPGQPLSPGKIYESNGVMVAALARRFGAVVNVYGTARDEAQTIHAALAAALRDTPDLVVTSGGVSAGDFDLVKRVLDEAGQITFWQIRQRPGKPLAFGHVQGVPLLGLPGNPLAAFVDFTLYGRAILRAMQGRDPLPAYVDAVCGEPIRNGSGRRNFLRGIATAEATNVIVRLAGGQLPTQLSTLAQSNCLIVAGEDRTLYEQGETIPILLLDQADNLPRLVAY